MSLYVPWTVNNNTSTTNHKYFLLPISYSISESEHNNFK